MDELSDELAQLATDAPPLPSLTDEDVATILTQLPLSHLPACAATCTQWAAVVRSDGLLWSAGFGQRFGGRVAPAEAYDACRRCITAVNALQLLPIKSSHSPDGESLCPRAGAAAGPLGPYVVLSGGATTEFSFTGHVDLWDASRRCVVASRRTLLDQHGQHMISRWQHSALHSGDALWLYGGTAARDHCPCGVLYAVLMLDARANGPLELGENSGIPAMAHSIRVPLCCEGDAATREGEGPALSGHTACAIGGVTEAAAMLTFGGETRELHGAHAVSNWLWRVPLPAPEMCDVLSADNTCRRVEAAGAPPSPRYCHAAERVREEWLIFGGWAKRQRTWEVCRKGFSTLGRPNQHRIRCSHVPTPHRRTGRPAAQRSGHAPLSQRPAPAPPEHDGMGAPRHRGRGAAGPVPGGDRRFAGRSAAARLRRRLPPRAGTWPAVWGTPHDASSCGPIDSFTHLAPAAPVSAQDMVQDLCDVALLHLPTLTWLPQKELPCHPPQRGGTNALVRAPGGGGEGTFIFGGMNSDRCGARAR